ncbi:sensor histidine kinase [Leucothrix pacifica]|uniref:histidine kinase n=1 Tax=Leucothrix pacifica TaxID=1247513 RepID=A0A317CI41_9GAMM|nr:HAMP domain-containing sensor histidine kinase [Leucothrix pacifica]PWQ98225.1 sensor histidine kinase [Leucothrix pacifica]
MIKNSLKTLDKQKLRRWLGVFFITLFIPGALLVQQSYTRLKWETFHQHQRMAEELSERIDSSLGDLLEKENQRPFTDYAFLNIAGDASAGFLQRSPLSNFPPESEIPGLLGYFQVDASGVLNTPLVPDDQSLSQSESYGINAKELDQRLSLQNQIQGILAAQNNRIRAPDVALNDMEVLAEAVEERLVSDALESAPVAQSAARKKVSLGKVEDLQLQQTYQKKESIVAKLKSTEPELVSRQSKVQISKSAPAPRFEQNVLPEASRDFYSSSLQNDSAADAPVERDKLRVKTFESEIDPFELQLLESGHFMLFRKVWLNEQRYIQGMLIKQNEFLDASVKQAFSSTGLSDMSNLLVAYKSDVLAAFSGRSNSGYLTDRRELMGEQLYQMRLSDPLSDLQLIYSIIQLPMGAGGQVIVWLGIVLASVLLGGVYLMYRLGVRQIDLVNQQQNFVSAVSHELKTPLTSIRMYGEMLREGWASEDKKRSYYDFIFDESERLSRLINNVLQLARMTRNEQQAELSECEVASLLRDIQSKITVQLERADYTLDLFCDESTKAATIEVDTDWLTQIMINLVDNAIKFSADSEMKKVELSCQGMANHQVSFTIRDFGPGIDKAQLKQIFKLFYRTENELTRETTGTGIGLSLVQQMVTSMGGTVAVENRKPGAAFSVTFPIKTL